MKAKLFDVEEMMFDVDDGDIRKMARMKRRVKMIKKEIVEHELRISHVAAEMEEGRKTSKGKDTYSADQNNESSCSDDDDDEEEVE